MFANASDDGIEDRGVIRTGQDQHGNNPNTHGHGMCEEPSTWYSSKEATTRLKTEERNPSS